jgi:hypothetical protein
MQLTHEVEKTFKRAIIYNKDCDELSVDIRQLTNRNISASTLRRVFGLLESKSKLSKYNRDTLELYISKKKELTKKIDNFNLSLKQDSINKEFADLKLLHGGLNDSFLGDVIDSNLHPNKVLKLLHFAILESFENEKINFFIELYRQNKLILSNIAFFRFFGSQLKKNISFCEQLLPSLAKESNARRYFFENYVDFDNFRIYRNWLLIYYEKEPTYLNKLWAVSLVVYGDILSDRESNLWSDYMELYKLCKTEVKEGHPMLKARVYGIGVLFPSKQEDFKREIIDELESNLYEVVNDAGYFPYFPNMICKYVLIFSKDADTLRLIFEILRKYSKINLWHHDPGVPFYVSILETVLSNTKIRLEDIKLFNSGHTNEDTPLKLFALQFVNEQNLEYQKYRSHLIEESGFVFFKDSNYRLNSLLE